MTDETPPAVRVFETPLGRMAVAATERGLAHVALPGPSAADGGWRTAKSGRPPSADRAALRPAPSARHCAEQAEREILEYLAGRRRKFTIPVDLAAVPPFRYRVLQACAKIPYGATVTYGQLAARVARPKAGRAVGQAMARNPVPLVIPCHRVIGADGSLGGFMGGVGGGPALKRRLLELEAASRPQVSGSKSRVLSERQRPRDVGP